MQFTTIASILAMATVAIGAPAPAPADIEARTGHGGGNTPVCSAKAKQVCCNGLLSCTVQVLGGSCGGNSYCCKTSAPVVSLPRIKTRSASNLYRVLSSTLLSSTASSSSRGPAPEMPLGELVESDIGNIWCGGY
jgi:hypothetical protein